MSARSLSLSPAIAILVPLQSADGFQRTELSVSSLHSDFSTTHFEYWNPATEPAFRPCTPKRFGPCFAAPPLSDVWQVKHTFWNTTLPASATPPSGSAGALGASPPADGVGAG